MATRRSSNKKPNVADARERYVSQVRLHHFLKTVSALHYGLIETRFEGDEREGRFFSTNTSGEHQAVAWDPLSVVAMAFDHYDAESEGPLPPEERNPERLFEDAPASLGPLVQRITTWSLVERLGTASRWISPEGDGGTVCSSERLERYEQTAKEALEGGRQGWRELASVSKTHARVATKLAKPAGGARQRIDADDGRALLTPPEQRRDVAPDPANVAQAVKAFARAGVDWPDGVEMATRLASAEPELGHALIDATFGGDLTERFSESTEGETARREQKQRAQEEVDSMALHCRMLHIVNAVRGIHYETGFSSVYRGTRDEGRFASTTTTKEGVERVVLAWHRAGLAGWASGPRVSLPTGDPHPVGRPRSVFASAPAHLHAMVEQVARWEHAPKEVTEALWIFPHAASSDGVRGVWGQTQNTGLWRKGTPIEATQLDAGLAAFLDYVVERSSEGFYPKITPEVEAAILAPQPEGAPTPRPEGVAEAVKRFAQIGVRWDSAVERAAAMQ